MHLKQVEVNFWECANERGSGKSNDIAAGVMYTYSVSKMYKWWYLYDGKSLCIAHCSVNGV